MNWIQVLALIASLLLGIVNGYNNWKSGQEIQKIEAGEMSAEVEYGNLPDPALVPPMEALPATPDGWRAEPDVPGGSPRRRGGRRRGRGGYRSGRSKGPGILRRGGRSKPLRSYGSSRGGIRL